MAEPIFSERTRIALPVALQLTLLTSVIGCTATVVWAAQSLKSKIEVRLDENSAGLALLKSEMYPLAVASEQALRTAIENPGMRVPDPRDPNRIIVVEGRK